MTDFKNLLNGSGSTPNNLISLLKQYRVMIPGIQRHYVQGENNKAAEDVRRTFINDIINSFTDRQEKMHLDFIYGPIETKDADAFVPVDGQQRLTTLWLLARYFVEFLEFTNDDREKEALKECLNLLRKFSYEGRLHAKRFCQALTNPENKLFKDKIGKISCENWCNPYWLSDSTVAAMLNTLKTISEIVRERFSHENLETSFEKCTEKEINLEEAKEFLIFIWEKITFNLVTEQFADDIYMKMNARGMPVTRWETFKGRFASALYEKAKPKQGEWQEKIEKLSDLFFRIMPDVNAQNKENKDSVPLPDNPFLGLLGRIIHFSLEKPSIELSKFANSNANDNLPYVPFADFQLETTAEKICIPFLNMLSYLLGKNKKDFLFPYWDNNRKLLEAVFYPRNADERDLGLILFTYFDEFRTIENDNDFLLALRLIANILENVSRDGFNRVNGIQRFFKHGASLYGRESTNMQDDNNKDVALQYLEEKVKGEIYTCRKDLIELLQQVECFMHGRVRLGILDIENKQPCINEQRLEAVEKLFEQWNCKDSETLENLRRQIVLMVVAAEPYELKDVINLSIKDDNLLALLTTRDDSMLQKNLMGYLIDKDLDKCSPDNILKNNAEIFSENGKIPPNHKRDWRQSILLMNEPNSCYDIWGNNAYRVEWHNGTGHYYLYRQGNITNALPINDYRYELWLGEARRCRLAKLEIARFKEPGMNDSFAQSGWYKIDSFVKDGGKHLQILFFPSHIRFRVVSQNKGDNNGTEFLSGIICVYENKIRIDDNENNENSYEEKISGATLEKLTPEELLDLLQNRVIEGIYNKIT